MDRFFLPRTEWQEDRLALAGEEGHHAVRVMRKKIGDLVEVFDGEGSWARGQITSLEKSSFELEISERGISSPLRPLVRLAVAVPKGKTFDLVIQKAVELGASEILPILTTNTVVQIGGKEAGAKQAKWQRLALEACKQCGQNVLPQVYAPATLNDFLKTNEEGLRVIASLAPGARLLREVLKDAEERPSQVTLLVGPEGDFTIGETEAALASGFHPVTLGDIVLRVDTACFFLLSALRYQYS